MGIGLVALLVTLSACSGGSTSGAGVVPLGQQNNGQSQLSPSSPASVMELPQSKNSVSNLALANVVPANFVAFTDTFESDSVGASATNWTVSSGAWRVCAPQGESHELCQTTSNAAISLVTDRAIADGDITSIFYDASPTQGGSAILGRLQDAGNFYQLEIRGSTSGAPGPFWYIFKHAGGAWVSLANGPFATRPSTKYALKMSFSGAVISASVAYDNAPTTFIALGSATDATWSSGQVGLRTWGVSTARFDNFSSIPTGTPPSPTPSGMASPTPIPSAPTPAGAEPTMTPIPAGVPPDNAFTIAAPTQPVAESTPAPLCIAGGQYAFSHGDDFQQESQSQFSRYTTQWEINQYFYNGAKSNWKWSDQYSGIGRRNDFGFGDTYMVHIDDANPSRSYPASWANSVQPRPGAQILGTAPNAYLDIRAVYVPAAHQGDPLLNGAHWLTGGIQEGPQRAFGYTEATVMMPSNDGAWPSVWQLATGGSNFYDGSGVAGYEEIDTFEKFGNSQGPSVIQMTANSGRPDAEAVRPIIPDLTTAYHKYGELWVPPLLGKPAYIVFYIDRIPVSYYLTEGIGTVNYMVNLQMGLPGSFVGAPDTTKVADLKLQNYFTWQAAGAPCDGNAQANPIPTPAATASPNPAPSVGGGIGPKLLSFNAPTLVNSSTVRLPAVPAIGSLLIAQGISNFASCPTGFTTTSWAVAYVCTGIVGQNGLAAQTSYQVGGAGFDRGSIVEIDNVAGYTVNSNIATGWHGEASPSLIRSQMATAPHQLALALGFGITDAPRYLTAETYAGNIPFVSVYSTPTDANYGRGMAMLASQGDAYNAPSNSVSISGSFPWAGPLDTVNGSNLLPEIITIIVR